MGFIFKPIRWLLGQIIIFVDWITRPKPVERSAEAQQAVDGTNAKHGVVPVSAVPFLR